MDINNVGIIATCILGLIIVGAIFKISLLKILKLIINSILGGVLIFFINQIGTSFGVHIGLNIITSIFIGIFGIPGAILLIVMKLF